MQCRIFLIFLCYFLCLTSQLRAEVAYAVVSHVDLIGNKKTNDKIIIRELDILPGDTMFISQINGLFLENEKRLLSTGLFTAVSINLKNLDVESKSCDIEIQLQENWYIYPNVIFELADRNFNVWWNEQNKSLDRVNYGFRLNHINLLGQRDQLKLTTQFGFTRKFEAEYSYPYLNREQTLGAAANIIYSENREIGYVTEGNKTLFHKENDERILLRRFRVSTWLNYRPSLFHYHRIKFEFHRNSIDPFIAKELNPDYFLEQIEAIRFFKIEYDFSIDQRIFSFYPEGGFLAGVNLKKEGLGIFGEYDNLILELRGEYYAQVQSKLIIANQIKLNTNLFRRQVAFANNTGLGYNGNIVSGYELYVMDGTDFVLNKSSIRWKAIDHLFNLDDAMPLRQFKLMNLKLYLTFNLDAGYVYEPTYTESNFLNNQWVVGYGPGIDLLLFNTYLLSFEYSFNELGESGLYFSNRVSF